MTWDEIGSVAEVIAAVAVVMSLVYLALQLRNQNRESRAAAVHEIWSAFRESIALLGDAQLSTVYTKALAQEELTDSEQMQLLVMIQSIYRVWEEAHMQWKRGRLDDTVWNSMMRQIVFVRGSQPFSHVWELRKEVYGQDFQEFIDGLPKSKYELRSAPISATNA